MKTTVLGLALAGALLVPAAYGVDEHHSEKAAPAAKAPKAPANAQADDKSVTQMQAHMKKMQDIMARMQKTADPAERQKLMNEHTQAMQEGMKTMPMSGMMGQAPKEGGSGMGGRGPMSPEMMERRMDMMQMMMEQMMQHQKALEGAPK
jgi:glycerol-3-phosphate O-acyltransferase